LTHRVVGDDDITLPAELIDCRHGDVKILDSRIRLAIGDEGGDSHQCHDRDHDGQLRSE
jgi:hypothetical protein